MGKNIAGNKKYYVYKKELKMNEKQILKKLLENSKLNISDLTDISSLDISKFILKYRGKGYITYFEGIIELTAYGQSEILKNRKELFLSPSIKEWLTVPEELRTQSIEINKQTNI